MSVTPEEFIRAFRAQVDAEAAAERKRKAAEPPPPEPVRPPKPAPKPRTAALLRINTRRRVLERWRHDGRYKRLPWRLYDAPGEAVGMVRLFDWRRAGYRVTIDGVIQE